MDDKGKDLPAEALNFGDPDQRCAWLDRARAGDALARMVRVWNFLLSSLLSCGPILIVKGQPGALDLTYVPQTPAYGTVEHIALQPDGKLVYTSQTGEFPPILQVSRLLPNGGADASFSNSYFTNGGVLTLTLDTQGRVLLGGAFASVQGQPCQGIARLEANGQLDRSFNPAGVDSQIGVLAVQPNGQILAGGPFTAFNGQPRNGLARLNPDGSLDPSFNPEAGVSVANNRTHLIQSVGMLPGGRLAVAGNFTWFNGVPRSRVACSIRMVLWRQVSIRRTALTER
jgi:uncharacterized delta-60 repeat protein